MGPRVAGEMTLSPLLTLPVLLSCALLSIACATAPPSHTRAPSDSTSAATPVAAPASATSVASAPQTPTMHTSLRHPGEPRTRSSGGIAGPEAPTMPGSSFSSGCADRKPGESWDVNGSSCMCDPGGQIRCSRYTSRHGQIH